MSRIELNSVISANWLNALSSTSAYQKKISSSVSGSSLSSSNNNQGVSVKSNLESGAKAFGLAYKRLNEAIEVLHGADQTLQNSEVTVSKLAKIAEEAKSDNLSLQQRRRMIIKFRALAEELNISIKNAQNSKNGNILSVKKVEDQLSLAGLKKEKIDQLKGLLSKYGEGIDTLPKSSVDSETADTQGVTGKAVTVNVLKLDKLLTLEQKLKSSKGASAVLTEIEKSLTELKSKRKDLGALYEYVGDNLKLVRSSAANMYELYTQIDSSASAESVAQTLRNRIISEVPEALSHIDNLDPIRVAALTSSEETK